MDGIALARHPRPAGRRAYWLARRTGFFTAVVGITGAAVWHLGDLLGEGGVHPFEWAILLVFALNFAWIAGGFVTASIGFLLTLLSRNPIARACPIVQSDPGHGAPKGRTALAMPIYNEDTARVFAGLAAMAQSLRETGHRGRFAFFLLSDSTDPAIIEAEEAQVSAFNEAFAADGGLTYRRREANTGKKAGNISDFCQHWGGDCDYMVVLDADSVMSGEALVRLARLMDRNPKAGIIQTLPRLVGQHTLFGRLEQFGYRLCCNVMALGLAFWQGPDGNYFGHNAIVRLPAFRDHCRLPMVSGRGPLSGEILSHDFVEAALMRRAGYEIWSVPDSRGSYESCPSNAIDHAKRDRRWCQGNMQHAWLLRMPGLRALSRLHLIVGIASYMASLWWLTLIALGIAMSGAIHPVLAYFSDTPSLFPTWPMDRSFGFFSLLVVTVVLLFVPKILGLLVLLFHPRSPYRRGGLAALLASALIEAVYSALRAPVLMIFHALFVTMIFIGRRIGWDPQPRGFRSIDLRTALLFHLPQILSGIVLLAVTLWLAPDQLWWIVPILSGLALCVPLTMAASSWVLGAWSRRAGLFTIPEEIDGPAEVRHLAPPPAGPSAPKPALDARPLDARPIDASI